jgi:hypothetical protein
VKRNRDSSASSSGSRQQTLSPTALANAKQAAQNNMQQVVRTSKRLKEKAGRHKRDVQLVLDFTSQYAGAQTQQLNERQSIYFAQTATLSLPADAEAPRSIDQYYEFRQEVCDSWTYESGEEQALGAFEQDGPYEPDYDDAQITQTTTAIRFQDEPGFSTTTRIEPGKWLVDYDVYFQWVVTAKYGNRESWTSPAVHHSMSSEYDAGQDADVNHAAAGTVQWTVDLPDRP